MGRRKRLTITVIVLAVLGLALDRGGQLAVERLAAGKIQDAVAAPTRPTVDLGGFPFLPELLRRTFDDVEIELEQADAGKVIVARVQALLDGVRQRGTGAFASSISGEGLITYVELSKAAAPLTVDYGGDGTVAVSAEVKVAGREFTASAVGRPRIEGNVLVIKPERATTSLGTSAGAAVVPEVRIELRDIPPNLTITLDPGPDGVRFTFSGRDVQLVGVDRTAAPANGQ